MQACCSPPSQRACLQRRAAITCLCRPPLLVSRSSKLCSNDAPFAEPVLTAGLSSTAWQGRAPSAGPPRGQLRGIDHDCNDIPDAAMTLAVAALFAEASITLSHPIPCAMMLSRHSGRHQALLGVTAAVTPPGAAAAGARQSTSLSLASQVQHRDKCCTWGADMQLGCRGPQQSGAWVTGG